MIRDSLRTGSDEEKGGPHLSIAEAELANLHVAAYNERLIALADREGLPITRLDLLGLDEDPANFYDCMHPSDAGYRMIAEAWDAELP